MNLYVVTARRRRRRHRRRRSATLEREREKKKAQLYSIEYNEMKLLHSFPPVLVSTV